MKKLALKLIVAAVVFSATTIRGGQAEEALSGMGAACDALRCYTVTIATHEVKGSQTRDITIDYSWNRTGWIKTVVVAGDNKGAVAVYDPGQNKIKVRWAGIALPVMLSPDSKSTQGLYGQKIYDGTFPAIYKTAGWYKTHGTISWVGEETLDGVACAVIDLKANAAGDNKGIARERWWLDKATSLPRKTEAFDANGVKVNSTLYKNLKLNPQLSEDHFNL
ncbi:outer membrane lipoprotein carrier protein LolA [bacterium]|nr:outer membrane lipoprotein carrier protein LolA [bacterium]